MKGSRAYLDQSLRDEAVCCDELLDLFMRVQVSFCAHLALYEAVKEQEHVHSNERGRVAACRQAREVGQQGRRAHLGCLGCFACERQDSVPRVLG